MRSPSQRNHLFHGIFYGGATPTAFFKIKTLNQSIMQNRYIFRGKRKDGQGWVEGSLIQYREKLPVIIGGPHERAYIVDPTTIGQIQGLLFDETQIFEGDVCSCSVVGIEGECLPIDYHVGEVINGTIGGVHICFCKNIKKLGNKYDDTSLLPKPTDMPF